MELKLAIKVHDLDNVATVFSGDAKEGDPLEVRDKKGCSESIPIFESIPFGHKIAVREISPGEPIIKYGETIGVATKRIVKGGYVHVHNLDSMRGRGDL